MHDLVEMSTAIQSDKDCSLGVADTRNAIGLVRIVLIIYKLQLNQLLSLPAT